MPPEIFDIRPKVSSAIAPATVPVPVAPGLRRETTLPILNNASRVVGRGNAGTSTRTSSWRAVTGSDLSDQLGIARFNLKIQTSQIAMHLKSDWRSGFFNQLDFLLDEGNWEKSDKLPNQQSFKTALRLITYLGNIRRPGLGMTALGNIVLSWTTGQDRLTVECLENDSVKWIVSQYINSQRESAAGVTNSRRFPQVITPYDPEKWLAPQ